MSHRQLPPSLRPPALCPLPVGQDPEVLTRFAKSTRSDLHFLLQPLPILCPTPRLLATSPALFPSPVPSYHKAFVLAVQIARLATTHH